MTKLSITFNPTVKRIKNGHQQIDEPGKIKRYIAPQAHVRAEPVQPGLLPEFALPLHLIPHGVDRIEEIGDLAILLVLLRGQKYALLGFLGQILAYGGHGKHNLLHGAVLTDYFDLSGVRRVVGERLVLQRVLGLDQHAELLVKLGKLVGEYVEVVADLTRRRALALLNTLIVRTLHLVSDARVGH